VESRALLIGDIFSNAAASVPHRVAAVSGDSSLTFGELDEAANRTARELQTFGLGLGDRVLTLAGTGTDLVVLFAAAAKLGVVFAPLNPGLSSSEATAAGAPCIPTVVVADAARAEVAAAVARSLSVALIDLEGLVGSEARPGPITERGLLESHPHVVFFTSGSSGTPKGAVLSHRTSYLRSHPGALLEPRGVMVCPFPLFHMGAWTIALQQWQARDAVVFVPSGDAASITAAVAQHHATRLNCIPALWRRILEHREAAQELTSLRFADAGTSATPPELLAAIADLVPQACVRVFYGSTEAGSVACLEQGDFANKPRSCGVPVPGATVRLDEQGVLWVRGPLLFDGYFGDPSATADVFDGEWFNTGDLADMDGDGYLSIVGRAGEVLRTGGESVIPSEVEAVLATHPMVADVAVVGVADPDWGQVVWAVVVPAGTELPSVEVLRSHCDGRLAPYKQPRRVVAAAAIPRTASTGQIQRRLLTEGLA
jgi:fatty-acyl-CoA synthase